MSTNTLPFALGSKATATGLNPLVGKTFKTPQGNVVRLCKTATAVTSPAKLAALYTVTGGNASYAKTILAASVASPHLAGIVDPDLEGNLAANDFFWVYCGRGEVVEFVGAAAIAAGLIVGTTTTVAGRLASLGAVATAATISDIGAALGVVIDATTSAGDTGKMRLLGPC